MTAFDSFVMFAEMRTGSNFLEANLNALPGVTCHGELFNPHFIGKKDQQSLFGIDLAARGTDPLSLWRAVRAATPGLAGFRYFHDHDPRIFDVVMNDRACAKIVLTRNPAESYVSWKIAQATGQWKLTNAKNLKTARIRFDAEEFERHLDGLHQFQIALQHRLQISGQTAFYLTYEDIQDIDVLNGLAAYLGVEARLDAPDGKLKKQNPEDLSSKVENYAEMAGALARIDRFDLSRTPCFEPRRPAAIPSYIAAGSLLYMPIMGGPTPQVRGFLAGLGPVETAFNRKSLRQWKLDHPGYRSFTVVRHPLVRAHAAFSTLLDQPAADLRTALQRVQGLKLPKPGRGFADAAAFRDGFMGFLRFLKLHLAGQTGLKIDARLASQSAAIQGFAQFTPPDAVLREDRLTEGLAWLAAETGAMTGAIATFLPAPPPVEPFPLEQIHVPELDAAAHEAYGRDFEAFGFSDWDHPQATGRQATGGSD